MKTKITMRRTYYLNNLLSKRHFLLAIALFATLTLTAQESCYEKYMCEHNKTILTAEDADDSYEDLKKAVLAKQIYGDSYLLMVDTIAQRAVITKVDGTYVADVHVALVDSTWYMWLSVDPLADKYPHISPYAYCAWNPMNYVDPDGRYFDDTNEEFAQKIETELFSKKIYASLGDGNRMRELYSTWNDIQDMRNDPQHEFRFESTSIDEPYPSTEFGGINAEGDPIINMYSPIEKLNGSTAHAVRHGGQVARGEMLFDNMGNPQQYGVMKEVDAYKAQWGWDGFINVFCLDKASIPRLCKPNYHNINPIFVNSITDGLSTMPLYPPTGYNLKLWNTH